QRGVPDPLSLSSYVPHSFCSDDANRAWEAATATCVCRSWQTGVLCDVPTFLRVFDFQPALGTDCWTDADCMQPWDIASPFFASFCAHSTRVCACRAYESGLNCEYTVTNSTFYQPLAIPLAGHDYAEALPFI